MCITVWRREAVTAEGQREGPPLSRPLGEKLKIISDHLIVMIGCVVSIAILKWVQKHTLGPEATLLTVLPVRSLLELGDLLVITRFIWQLFSTLFDD